MDVDPKTLLFTQDSIKNTFKFPRENERIDDAVEAILRGDLKASDFPALTVVSCGGYFWSLDNRRLWVFKKARVPSVTVQLISSYSSTRFKELITRNQALVKRILEPGYWPRVRGNCRSSFDPPVQNFYNYLPVESKPLLRSMPRRDYVHDNYNSLILPGLNNPRLEGPVRELHGEGIPYFPRSSARVANADNRSVLRVSDAGENQFTTAKKTFERWEFEPEVACGRRDGIQKRWPAPQVPMDVGRIRNYWRLTLHTVLATWKALQASEPLSILFLTLCSYYIIRNYIMSFVIALLMYIVQDSEPLSKSIIIICSHYFTESYTISFLVSSHIYYMRVSEALRKSIITVCAYRFTQSYTASSLVALLTLRRLHVSELLSKVLITLCSYYFTRSYPLSLLAAIICVELR